MRTYIKGITTVVITVLAAIVPLLAQVHVTPSQWVNVAIVGVGAVLVVIVPNVPVGVAEYAKAIIAALSAVLVFIASVIDRGLTLADWIQVIIVAAGAVGVTALDNKGDLHERLIPALPGTPGKDVPAR